MKNADFKSLDVLHAMLRSGMGPELVKGTRLTSGGVPVTVNVWGEKKESEYAPYPSSHHPSIHPPNHSTNIECSRHTRVLF